MSKPQAGIQKSIRFSPEEVEIIERHAARLGGFRPAVLAGLAALEERAEPTDEELLEMLARRLAARRA